MERRARVAIGALSRRERRVGSTGGDGLTCTVSIIGAISSATTSAVLITVTVATTVGGKTMIRVLRGGLGLFQLGQLFFELISVPEIWLFAIGKLRGPLLCWAEVWLLSIG